MAYAVRFFTHPFADDSPLLLDFAVFKKLRADISGLVIFGKDDSVSIGRAGPNRLSNFARDSHNPMPRSREPPILLG